MRPVSSGALVAQIGDRRRYLVTIAVNPARGLRFEIEVAVRLMVDNASSAFLPPLVFTGVACVHSRANLQTTVLALAASTLLFLCYNYVFDAANQAVGAARTR